MAHHGTDPFINEASKKFFDTVSKLGATNRFPEGKLNDSDEGEIMIGVTESEGKIIISFGDKPMLTKEQAKSFAELLLKRAT